MLIPHTALRSCVLCCWPGLSQLWLRGSWWGLLFAMTFAALINFQLAVSLVWQEWVDSTTVTVGWGVVVAVWCIGVWSAKDLVESPSCRHTANEDDVNFDSRNSQSLNQREKLFYRAQQEYLCRNWLETEHLLDELLRLDPLDLECQLMIAAVYRLTDRPEQSRRALRHLDRMDSSGKWKWEIRQEREKLNRIQQASESELPDGLLETAA